MKYFISYIAVLATFLGHGELLGFEDTFGTHLTHYWSAYENELHMNVSLTEEMIFSESYKRIHLKDGFCCEIVCKPQDHVTLLSEEGFQLQEIRFSVELKNADTLDQVICTVVRKSFYNGVNSNGKNISRIAEYTEEMTLYTTPIDLTQPPRFYIINNNWHEGFISFI